MNQEGPKLPVDGEEGEAAFPCVPRRMKREPNPDGADGSSGLGSNDGAGADSLINVTDKSDSPGGGLNVNEEPVVDGADESTFRCRPVYLNGGDDPCSEGVDESSFVWLDLNEAGSYL